MKSRTGAVNIPIALFSLALAIILWTIVFPIRSVRSRTRFEVPLDTIALDAFQRTKYVLRHPPTTVTVYAKVSEDEATRFRNECHATVTLPEGGELPTGNNRFPVSIYPRDLERLVTQDGANPSVPVEIEAFKKIDRMPIIADSSGKLSNPSLVVNEMSIEPKTATIEGPESIVSQVKSIHATLPLEKVMPLSPAPLDVPLEAFDANNQIVSNDGFEIHPSTVQVTPKLSQTPSTKQLFVEARFTGQVPDGYYVKDFSVSPNPITASGSSIALKRISNVQTELIDVSQLTSSQVLTVQLVAPPDVQLVPKEVRVSIQILPKSMKGLSPPVQKPGPTGKTSSSGPGR